MLLDRCHIRNMEERTRETGKSFFWDHFFPPPAAASAAFLSNAFFCFSCMMAAAFSFSRANSLPDIVFFDFALDCFSKFFARAFSLWLPRVIFVVLYSERWKRSPRDGAMGVFDAGEEEKSNERVWFEAKEMPLRASLFLAPAGFHDSTGFDQSQHRISGNTISE